MSCTVGSLTLALVMHPAHCDSLHDIDPAEIAVITADLAENKVFDSLPACILAFSNNAFRQLRIEDLA